MAPQALVIDVVLAVKNGPPGMWRALSDPSRILPFGPPAWWLWPLACGLVVALAWGVRRIAFAWRRAGTPAGPHSEVIDLAARRHSRAGWRRGSRRR